MLISLEGLDGSGKTSTWRALRERFETPEYTHEPTDSWYGRAVDRSIADPDADPLAELFLYTADHADHVRRVIEPALSGGTPVISDRYSDSRFAYQGASLGGVLDDPVDYVRSIHKPWSRPPDLTLYFDVDPVTGAERSGSTNKFEQVEYLETVRENYERLLAGEPERFRRIDTSRALEDVIDEAVEIVAAAIDRG